MTEQLAGGLFANNALDLTNSIDRKKLVLAIENDIDAACRAEFAEDPRTHLGASVIGDDCRAKAWNAFRWLKFEQFDGVCCGCLIAAMKKKRALFAG